LLFQHRGSSNGVIPLTHNQLAGMLDVQRTTVTAAARGLAAGWANRVSPWHYYHPRPSGDGDSSLRVLSGYPLSLRASALQYLPLTAPKLRRI
jgi:hypothetical protein